jgi:uncharacterized Zn-binding protein involved in type VI secretion
MRKAAVRHGDPTTTRGFVIAVTSTIFDNRKQVALSGDEATCGNCKGAWKIYGTGKGMSEKGRDVVVDGDLVLCPCKKNRVIVGSNPGIFLHTGNGSASATVTSSATPTAASSIPVYDEQVALIDALGNPLSDTFYTVIFPSGQWIHGTTDSYGLTDRFRTENSARLKVLLGHRQEGAET